MAGLARRVLPPVAAVATARAGIALLDRSPLARVPGWRRRNFRDREVSLSGGVAAALGGAAGAVVAGDPRAATLTLAAAAAGAYDDLVAPRLESRGDKGLSGHLAALRAGRVSGGVVKVLVVGGTAWWAVGPAARSWPDRVLRTVAVAGTANLVNLLDLRPGRAGKVVAAQGLVTAAPLGWAAAGAAVGVLPDDLGERVMLGDTGANALGALLGLRLAGGSGRTAAATAAVVTALILASERVSFSAVIARTSWLRVLDDLGRLPPDAP